MIKRIKRNVSEFQNDSKSIENRHLYQVTNTTYFHANNEETLYTPYNFYDSRNLLGDFSDVNTDEFKPWDTIDTLKYSLIIHDIQKKTLKYTDVTTTVPSFIIDVETKKRKFILPRINTNRV